MVGVDEAKATLRERLRAARRALPARQREAESAATVATCLRLAEDLGAAVVASYAALADELDLDGLHLALWRRGQGVLLSRVAGPGRLSWHRVSGPADLVRGAFGIREPDPTRAPALGLPSGCLVLVPGVGFTRQGQRLGQGGGFYDRALSGTLVAVGVGFTGQLVEDLPTAAHDRRLDGVAIAGELVLTPRLPT